MKKQNDKYEMDGKANVSDCDGEGGTIKSHSEVIKR